MNKLEVAKAVDIHGFLDRLEKVSTVQDYYKINHLTPAQRDAIAIKIASTLLEELAVLGLNIKR